MRTLIEPGVAGLDRIPLCLYCLDEGNKVKAQYDFWDKNGHWMYGCRPHWAKNRKTEKLGTGFGVRLVLKNAVWA
jgi:hypothetical protein